MKMASIAWWESLTAVHNKKQPQASWFALEILNSEVQSGRLKHKIYY